MRSQGPAVPQGLFPCWSYLSLYPSQLTLLLCSRGPCTWGWGSQGPGSPGTKLSKFHTLLWTKADCQGQNQIQEYPSFSGDQECQHWLPWLRRNPIHSGKFIEHQCVSDTKLGDKDTIKKHDKPGLSSFPEFDNLCHRPVWWSGEAYGPFLRKQYLLNI